MASKEKIVAVADIGTSKIAVIAGKKTGDKIEILGYGKIASGGIKRGIVLNIDEAAKVINEIITQVEDQYDGEIKLLDVAIAGQLLKSNQFKISREITDGAVVTREMISEMITEAKNAPVEDDYITYHILPQQYMVDEEGGMENPIGMAGKKLSAVYQLLSAPEQYKFNVQMVLDRIQVDLHKPVLSPLATAEAVLTDDEKEAGVVLVDIGGGITKMAVYYNNLLCYSSVIPFGGNVITKDIKEGCSIIPRWAEQLKVQYGQAMGDFAEEEKVVTIPGNNGWEPKEISFKSLAYIIQARLEEIIDNVYYHLESSGFLEKMGAGVVLTGGTSKLPNLIQLIKFRTGLDARIGRPIINLARKNPELMAPEYLTALGLLKLSLEDAAYEEAMRKAGKKNGKNPISNLISNKFGFVKEKVTQGFFEFFDDTDVEM
jgi:cell division protein FtsA